MISTVFLAYVAVIIALSAPLAQALAAALAPPWRGFASIAAASALLAVAVVLVLTREPALGAVILARPLPDAAIAMQLEPLGLIAMAVIALINFALTLYVAGLAGIGEAPGPREEASAALCVLAAVGVALSANLFTLILASAVLAASIAPLFWRSSLEPLRGARVQLFVVLAGVVGLLLPAASWTYALANEVGFRPGGILSGKADAVELAVLLLLFVIPLGQAGLYPFARWIVTAAGALSPLPACVAAGIAATAGAFALLKVMLYIFGPALLTLEGAEAVNAATAAAPALLWFSAIAASIAALRAETPARRVALVLAAQFGLIIAGAISEAPAARFGAMLNLGAAALAGVALFMGLSVARVAAGDPRALAGLGRAMPVTFTGFALAALALIGFGPFMAAIGRHWQLAGAAERAFAMGDGFSLGLWWIGAAVMAGASLLNLLALAPLVISALFGPAPKTPLLRPDVPTAALVAPLLLLALIAALAGLGERGLALWLAPVWGAA